MKSKRNKVWILICIVILIVIFLIPHQDNKIIKKYANIIVEAVANNNMKTVETIIFGKENLIVDEELAEFFLDFESEGNGIISKIVEQDSIKVKKVTDEYIIYEIIAPELSNIFQDAMKEENLTADSFEEYIYHYIATADKTKIQVEVAYTYEDGVFIADYTTQDFINGITGNLITAYQDLIQQMIQENSGEGTE